MNPLLSLRLAPTVLTGAAALLLAVPALAQAPAAPAVPAAAAPAGVSVGLPGASAAQNAAVAEMTTATTALATAVTTARNALSFAIYSEPTNEANLRAKADAVRDAEQALATAKANAFAAIQASPNRLNAEQTSVLVWQSVRLNLGGARGGGRGRGAAAAPTNTGPKADGFEGLGRGGIVGGGNPSVVGSPAQYLSDTQITEITRLNEQPELERLAGEVRTLRNAAQEQIFAATNDAAALKAKIDAWGAAETRLALAKAAAFVRFQASSRYKLSPEQVTTLANGNIGGRGGL